MCIDIEKIMQHLHEFRHFAIFGAQVVAYGAFVALRAVYSTVPDCFLVSHAVGNPSEIEGIAVRRLDACGLDPGSTLVIIAVTELLQGEVAEALGQKGFIHTFRLGAHAEHSLMASYFDTIGRFPLLKVSGNAAYDSYDLAVYETRNHRDKPLSSPPRLEAWEHSIQAGAELADVRLCELIDSTGVNISAKNKQYCEMSATYWIWKNTVYWMVGARTRKRALPEVTASPLSWWMR